MTLLVGSIWEAFPVLVCPTPPGMTCLSLGSISSHTSQHPPGLTLSWWVLGH